MEPLLDAPTPKKEELEAESPSLLTQIEGGKPYPCCLSYRSREHSIAPFRGQMRSMGEEEESSRATDENVLLH